jgi:hypothetical protein
MAELQERYRAEEAQSFDVEVTETLAKPFVCR